MDFSKDIDYFNIGMIRHYFDSKNLKYSDVSIKQYLHNLTKEKIIFDAGRGWYSTIGEPFQLDIAPLENIIEFMRNKFPLLQFSCWSTEQIKYFFHLDFLIENKKLLLTGESEYQVVFQNIVTRYRINISKLLRYAKRRKVASEIGKLLNIPMSLSA